jgi:hypothetical protein
MVPKKLPELGNGIPGVHFNHLKREGMIQTHKIKQSIEEFCSGKKKNEQLGKLSVPGGLLEEPQWQFSRRMVLSSAWTLQGQDLDHHRKLLKELPLEWKETLLESGQLPKKPKQ